MARKLLGKDKAERAAKKLEKAAKADPDAKSAAPIKKDEEPLVGAKKRKRRRRRLWLKEIRDSQKSTEMMTSKAAFERLVREIMQGINDEMRIQPQALQALRISSEEAIVELMQRANTLAVKIGGREGPLARDFDTAARTFDHFVQKH